MLKRAVGVFILVFITGFLPINDLKAQVRTILFPVNGKATFRNDYSEPRGGGTREHLGIDIIADKMTPVVAVADGEVTFIAIPQASWGYAITIRDNEGYSYRYLHLNNDTPGTDDGAGGPQNAYSGNLERGTRVTRGQVLGWVGDSGNAEATASHLHFEIMDQNRNHINPYDSLLSASNGNTGQSSTVVITHTGVATTEEEKFIATRSLQEGMTDKDITELHTQLKALGYYSGNLTSTYTAMTREAVRNFQNQSKIFSTGIADPETRVAIASAYKLLPVSVTAISTSSSNLAFGSRGEEVSRLQTRLKELGFFQGEATGYFGAATKSAVIEFQKANNLEQVGFVGPKTYSLLYPSAPTSTVGTSSYIFTRTLQTGSRGEDVRILQILLKRNGFMSAEPTSYFGNLTKSAVINFQIAKGIEPLGIVGPKTRALLNTL